LITGTFLNVITNVDVTSAEVQSHIEDYIQGAIHDSRHERMDCIVDSLLDLQD
jgi:hypothetical protein